MLENPFLGGLPRSDNSHGDDSSSPANAGNENSPRPPKMPGSTPPSAAGVKRSAPSLLPAFEYSSSPSLPRPVKRVARDSPSKSSTSQPHTLPQLEEKRKYPTPVPTSSTDVLPSSPPLPAAATRARAPLKRTISVLSERAPLSSLPVYELDATGEPLLFGRSTKSSHHQLSANRLISRVHVQAAYQPAEPPQPAKVEILCTGWNGLKAHCQGKKWELNKDDSFVSHSRDADIIVDVADARILLRWPRPTGHATTPETESAPNSSPRRGPAGAGSPFSSPLRGRGRMQSPISPSPAAGRQGPISPVSRRSASAPNEPPLIQIYEDPRSDEDEGPEHAEPTQSTQKLTQPLGHPLLELPHSDEYDFASDRDEENDPVVHAMYGANLVPRMAAMHHAQVTPEPDSPRDRAAPRDGDDSTAAEAQAPSPYVKAAAKSTALEGAGTDSAAAAVGDEHATAVVNHVVNQLAFSRVASTPLSTIHGALPADLKAATDTRDALSPGQLRALLDASAGVGAVPRAGKDAAGKPLESEYYYVPEEDEDETRRDAVIEGLGRRGMRNCRKQHKVWSKRRELCGDEDADGLTAILLAQAEMMASPVSVVRLLPPLFNALQRLLACVGFIQCLPVRGCSTHSRPTNPRNFAFIVMWNGCHVCSFPSSPHVVRVVPYTRCCSRSARVASHVRRLGVSRIFACIL